MEKDIEAETQLTNARGSVVIVGYNSGHVLPACLKGLTNSDTLELILVDNASSDNTVEEFVRMVPDGIVIKRPTNGGFAVAVNEGARAASGEFIVLLNPDAIIGANELMELFRTLDHNAVAGAVSPVLSSGVSSDATIPAGRAPTTYRMGLHATGLSRLSKYSRAFEGVYLLRAFVPKQTVEVDWISGGCMVVRRTCWTSLGGLTERWFMYAEDVEFCHRLRSSGSTVLLAGHIFADHRVGGSSKNVDGRTNTVWLRNLYEFYSSSIARSDVSRAAWIGLVSAGFFLRAAVYWSRSLFVGPSQSAAHRKLRESRLYATALLSRR